MIWLIVWAVVLVVLCALFKKAEIKYWLLWAILSSVAVMMGGTAALWVVWGTVAMLFKIVIWLAILAVVVLVAWTIIKYGS